MPDRCYCNPPFSKKASFVRRACEEATKGKLIVMLLPSDISTKWFADAFFKYKASAILIAGRRIHGRSPRYPSMLLIFNGRGEVHVVKYTELGDFLLNYLDMRGRCDGA